MWRSSWHNSRWPPSPIAPPFYLWLSGSLTFISFFDRSKCPNENLTHWGLPSLEGFSEFKMAAKAILQRTNNTYLYTWQKMKKITDHILRCHAKFHNNSRLNNRVMGLWKLTKLLPFCTLTRISPKVQISWYIPNNKKKLHMHWLSYMWSFNVFE